MATERRLTDPSALLESIEGIEWYTINYKGEASQGAPCEEVAWYKATDIYSAIENAPTVDAVEVVRCKDCKHYHPHNRSVKWNCKKNMCCRSAIISTPPDGYCSYGERSVITND